METAESGGRPGKPARWTGWGDRPATEADSGAGRWAWGWWPPATLRDDPGGENALYRRADHCTPSASGARTPTPPGWDLRSIQETKVRWPLWAEACRPRRRQTNRPPNSRQLLRNIAAFAPASSCKWVTLATTRACLAVHPGSCSASSGPHRQDSGGPASEAGLQLPEMPESRRTRARFYSVLEAATQCLGFWSLGRLAEGCVRLAVGSVSWENGE